DDGNLTPRGNPDAMVHDPDQAVANVLAMIRDQQLVSTSGKEIPAEVQSICVHGDGPTAIALARAVRAGIEAEGIAIAPLPEVIAA
ncbi:MAG: LamB/YcsF family protein, partial [Pseudomonadota bacterium]|nr:LamB/YcsF family protein [Pseudomonadota bacterium]